MTYANYITFLRITCLPLIVAVFFISNENSRWLLSCIFFTAAITDFLDGFFARRFNQITSLGKFLDPVADKLLVIISLLLVLIENNNLLFFIPVSIIILREVLISALREWMAIQNYSKILVVNTFGKVKTFFQLIAIGFLLFNGTIFTINTYAIGLYGIYIAAFLSLVSMIIYIQNVIRS